MKYINLESTFILPTHEDYDDAIAGMQQDIVEEGSPRLFLGTIRSGRRTSRQMNRNVLLPLSEHAFSYEDPSKSGSPPSTDLRMSKAMLSGMLFGHIANEGLYPRMYDVDPYRSKASINVNFLDEVVRASFLEKHKRSPASAYRMGAQAMSALFIDGLSEDSIKTLVSWAEDVVGDERVHYFTAGFGTALYLAWDAYSDILMKSGREDNIYTFPAFSVDRG